ncbi:MAG: FHIPEP family type III secretion protein, partial [Dehalococcoidia bacterium]
ETIRRYAPSILSRQDVQMLLNNLKEEYPAVVEDLVPNVLTIGEIQQVLQNLLAERIPIRDLITILEALANHAGTTRDPELLTEYVRSALSRSITAQYQDSDSKLHVLTLSPGVEALLAESLRDDANQIVLDPAAAQQILTELSTQMEHLAQFGRQPVLLCSSRLRRPLRRLTERALPGLSILSFSEVAADADVQAEGVVEVLQS